MNKTNRLIPVYEGLQEEPWIVLFERDVNYIKNKNHSLKNFIKLNPSSISSASLVGNIGALTWLWVVIALVMITTVYIIYVFGNGGDSISYGEIQGVRVSMASLNAFKQSSQVNNNFNQNVNQSIPINLSISNLEAEASGLIASNNSELSDAVNSPVNTQISNTKAASTTSVNVKAINKSNLVKKPIKSTNQPTSVNNITPSGNVVAIPELKPSPVNSTDSNNSGSGNDTGNTSENSGSNPNQGNDGNSSTTNDQNHSNEGSENNSNNGGNSNSGSNGEGSGSGGSGGANEHESEENENEGGELPNDDDNSSVEDGGGNQNDQPDNDDDQQDEDLGQGQVKYGRFKAIDRSTHKPLNQVCINGKLVNESKSGTGIYILKVGKYYISYPLTPDKENPSNYTVNHILESDPCNNPKSMKRRIKIKEYCHCKCKHIKIIKLSKSINKSISKI